MMQGTDLMLVQQGKAVERPRPRSSGAYTLLRLRRAGRYGNYESDVATNVGAADQFPLCSAVLHPWLVPIRSSHQTT